MKNKAIEIAKKYVGKLPDNNSPSWESIRNGCTEEIVDLVNWALIKDWNLPSVEPISNSFLQMIVVESAKPYLASETIFYMGDKDEMRGCMAWRYDNANEILNLLNKNIS